MITDSLSAAIEFVAWAIVFHAIIHGPSSNSSAIESVADAVKQLAESLRRKDGP